MRNFLTQQSPTVVSVSRRVKFSVTDRARGFSIMARCGPAGGATLWLSGCVHPGQDART